MAAVAIRVPKQRYHHGELRSTLLKIALEMLSSTEEPMSVRLVARKAGVSQTALYHHYPGRTGLLAAVARVGYENLTRLLPREHETLAPSESFAELVDTYVGFATRNRLLFHLMFDRTLKAKHPELETAGQVAFESLRRWLAETFSIGAAEDGETRILALWSLMHGLASLRLSQLAGTSEQAPHEVARRFAYALATRPEVEAAP